MEDRSSSGKRQSTSIRVTPSKPDSKRERVEVAGGERGTRVKKSLLFGSTSGCKSSEKKTVAERKGNFIRLCVFLWLKIAITTDFLIHQIAFLLCMSSSL